MKRFKLEIEYKGTNFSGWQVQPKTKTIEGELETAFSNVLQQPIDLIGQGRTDAGVHAKAQVAHFDVETDLESKKMIRAVNSILDDDIYITSILETDADFHSRFDANSRSYAYTILKCPSPIKNEIAWYPGFLLNIDLINQCSDLIKGTYDFHGFSKYDKDNYTSLCTITNARWVEKKDVFIFKVEANRFLRNMVRRLVGTMCEVSRGKLTTSDFINILKNKTGVSSNYKAPAKGLTLKKVFYKKCDNVLTEE